MKVTGKIKPLGSKIFVTDMDFGEEKTTTGIVVPSSDGKVDGIIPRWGKVWAIGPDQEDVKIGEWVLIEHGQWTRGIDVEEADEVFKIRMVNAKSILMTADEKPNQLYRRVD
jgi:co-chaperonin GroES (HSP10)